MVNNVDNATNLNIAMAEFAQTLEVKNQIIAALVGPNILGLERLRRQLTPSIRPSILGNASLSRSVSPSVMTTIRTLETLTRLVAPPISPTILGIESLRRRATSSVMTTASGKERLRRQYASSLLCADESRQRSIEVLSSASRTRRRRMASEIPQWSLGNDIAIRDSAGLGKRSEVLVRFDSVVTDRKLRQLCRKLLADGHYTLAVEQAFKFVNNMVKEKSGVGDKDGADLMWKVFSDNSPGLMLNPLQSQSDKRRTEGLYAHLRRSNDGNQKSKST